MPLEVSNILINLLHLFVCCPSVQQTCWMTKMWLQQRQRTKSGMIHYMQSSVDNWTLNRILVLVYVILQYSTIAGQIWSDLIWLQDMAKNIGMLSTVSKKCFFILSSTKLCVSTNYMLYWLDRRWWLEVALWATVPYTHKVRVKWWAFLLLWDCTPPNKTLA